MRKGDTGKKVLGVILILAIIVSVFGGIVTAEDVSGGVKTKCCVCGDTNCDRKSRL